MKLNVKSKSIARAGAILLIAGGVGVFVQSGGPSQASVVATEPNKVIAAEAVTEPNLPLSEFGLGLPSDQTVPTDFPVRVVALDVAVDVPTAQMPTEEVAPLLGCDVSARAVPAVAAMVNLHVQATCLPNARIRIEHSGLRFSEYLNDAGELQISVPALSVDSRFTITFPNGTEANAVAHVPDLKIYNRISVQWTGESGLQIHAREAGADYGQDGHVWFGSQGDLIDLVAGKSGYLVRLGDGMSDMSLMADVYTYPSDADDIALTLEAEVNGANCNREIDASTLQIDQSILGETHSINLMMPDCGATGDFLVLKNLFQTRTIAQQ